MTDNTSQDPSVQAYLSLQSNTDHYQNHLSTQQHQTNQLSTVPIGGDQQLSTVYIAPLYPITGSDGYVAAPTSGFTAPPSGPHQNTPVLRSMQSTAQPVQSQQQDLSKMQQPPQQSMFVQAGTSNGTQNVRPNHQNGLFRPNSNTAVPRPRNHSLLPPIFQAGPPMIMQTYANYTPARQQYQMSPSTQNYIPGHVGQNFPYSFLIPNHMMQPSQHRGGVVSSGLIPTNNGPTIGTGSGANQPPLPMQPGTLLTSGQQATVTTANTNNTKKRRRPNAIPIIDPITKEEVVAGYKESDRSSPPVEEFHDQLSSVSSSSNLDTLSGGTQASHDLPSSGINVDTINSNPKDLQGAFMDMMQQHKISAIAPSSQNAHNRLANEFLNNITPVVSAMSDGPSVEIHPKQPSTKSKKLSRSIEIVAPPSSPPLQPAITKIQKEETQSQKSIETPSEDNKVKSIDNGTKTPHWEIEDNQKSSNIPIETSTVEETKMNIPETKAIKAINKKDSNTNQIQNSNSSTIVSTGTISNTDNKELKSVKTIVNSNINNNTNINNSNTNNNKGNINNNTGVVTNNTTTISNTALYPPIMNKNIQQKIENNNCNHLLNENDNITSTTANNLVTTIINTDNKILNQNTNVNNKSEKIKLSNKDDKNKFINNIEAKANMDSINKNTITSSRIDKKGETATSGVNSKKSIDKNDNLTQNQIHKQQININNQIIEEDTPNISKIDEIRIESKINFDSNKKTVNSITNNINGSDGVTYITQNSIDETDKSNLSTNDSIKNNCINNNNIIEKNIVNNNEKDIEKDNTLGNNYKEQIIEIKNKIKQKDKKLVDMTENNDKTSPNSINLEGNSNNDKLEASIKHENVITNQTQSSLIPNNIISGINKENCSPIITIDSIKSYNREQLFKLRDTPESKSKPVVGDSFAHLLQTAKSAQTVLMPRFMHNNNNNRRPMISGNTSISGNSNINGNLNSNNLIHVNSPNQYSKQNSMSGINAKTNSKGSKSGMINMSLSLREDVKLNETENAWKPAHLKYSADTSAEEIQISEIKRKVCGILNKLTPEKFDSLVEQILNLQLDTQSKIHDVMMLVFEKAVDEPNFSVSYAKLCSKLADKLSANSNDSSNEKKTNLLLFRSKLLDKTQSEFTDNVVKHESKDNKLKPLMDEYKQCSDPEKKLELQANLEEEERKIRRRAVGTVKFIGELFKINMLTGNIIHKCIQTLLDPTSEDKLECLCKLLTTVGCKFEKTVKTSDPVVYYNLNDIISKMQNIVNRKNFNDTQANKISSRVRFMLQDVIDLRKSKWVSTRNDLNPKTMDQIQKEAENEQMNAFLNYSMQTNNKKDDRRFMSSNIGIGNNNMMSHIGGGNLNINNGNSTNNSYYKSSSNPGRQQIIDDTWQRVQPSKSNRAVDTNKLNMTNNYDSEMSIKFGARAQYDWGRANTGSTSLNSPKPNVTNSFAALSNLESNKAGGSKNSLLYNKGSMERDKYDGVHSRTGSLNRSRESSSSRLTGQGSSNISNMTKSSSHNYSSSNTQMGSNNLRPQPSPTPTNTKNRNSPIETNIEKESNIEDRAIFNQMIKNNLDKSHEECITSCKSFSESSRWKILYIILEDYLHLYRNKSQERRSASEMIILLYGKNLLTIDDIKMGYTQFCEVVEDLMVDIPTVWQNVIEFIGPLLAKEIVNVRDIWNKTLPIYQSDISSKKKFLEALLMYSLREIGPMFTQKMWKTAKLKWTEFLPADEVDKFIKDHQFEFVESSSAPLPINPNVNMVNIHTRINDMLESKATANDVIDYINGNITCIDKEFIRDLTKTLCLYASIDTSNYKLNQKLFKTACIPILQRFLDSNEELELQCLYAIQNVVVELEHPPGLLMDIFSELYEADIIPQEALKKWKESKEEMKGKGVAVKGLTSFFNNMFNQETSDENN